MDAHLCHTIRNGLESGRGKGEPEWNESLFFSLTLWWSSYFLPLKSVIWSSRSVIQPVFIFSIWHEGEGRLERETDDHKKEPLKEGFFHDFSLMIILMMEMELEVHSSSSNSWPLTSSWSSFKKTWFISTKSLFTFGFIVMFLVLFSAWGGLLFLWVMIPLILFFLSLAPKTDFLGSPSSCL